MKLSLGIDVGTSKVATCIVNSSQKVLSISTKQHNAQLPSEDGKEEQDPMLLWKTVEMSIAEHPKEMLKEICGIGVSGQMHGCILVDTQCGRLHTPLITWQDKRYSSLWLEQKNARYQSNLCAGYACATLLWLSEKETLHNVQAMSAGGFIVWKLCSGKTTEDATICASFGMLDAEAMQWKAPKHILPFLPTPVAPGTIAGHLHVKDIPLPPHIPVLAAIGDAPSSMLATLNQPSTDIGLTIGTASQMSIIVPKGRYQHLPSSCEYRPFVGDKALLVAPALLGGGAWRALACAVQSWIQSMGLEPPSLDSVFSQLNQLGEKASMTEDTLRVYPNWRGERHAPGILGRVEGIDERNLGDVGAWAWKTAVGIIQNLVDMLPPFALEGKQRVVGSGNALQKNALLCKAVTFVLPEMELVLQPAMEEAAKGASLLVFRIQ